MTISPAQSRAARGLLEWSQVQLATAASVSESTIRDFEKGRRVPSVNNLAAIRRALETAGVIFVEENGEGPGVRLRNRAFRETQSLERGLNSAVRKSGGSPVSPLGEHVPEPFSRLGHGDNADGIAKAVSDAVRASKSGKD